MQILVITFNTRWIQDEKKNIKTKIFRFVIFAELCSTLLQEPFSTESDHS